MRATLRSVHRSWGKLQWYSAMHAIITVFLICLMFAAMLYTWVCWIVTQKMPFFGRWLIRVSTIAFLTCALLFLLYELMCFQAGGKPFRSDAVNQNYYVKEKGVVTEIRESTYCSLVTLERINHFVDFLLFPATICFLAGLLLAQRNPKYL